MIYKNTPLTKLVCTFFHKACIWIHYTYIHTLYIGILCYNGVQRLNLIKIDFLNLYRTILAINISKMLIFYTNLIIIYFVELFLKIYSRHFIVLVLKFQNIPYLLLYTYYVYNIIKLLLLFLTFINLKTNGITLQKRYQIYIISYNYS